MAGFVIVLFAAGVLSGIGMFLFAPLRPLSPFALVAVFASLGAALLCWIFGIGLERAFGESAGGIGFFGGYILGGLLGALLGYKSAVSIRIDLLKDANADRCD
jgi:hypothetical protein